MILASHLQLEEFKLSLDFTKIFTFRYQLLEKRVLLLEYKNISPYTILPTMVVFISKDSKEQLILHSRHISDGAKFSGGKPGGKLYFELLLEKERESFPLELSLFTCFLLHEGKVYSLEHNCLNSFSKASIVHYDEVHFRMNDPNMLFVSYQDFFFEISNDQKALLLTNRSIFPIHIASFDFFYEERAYSFQNLTRDFVLSEERMRLDFQTTLPKEINFQSLENFYLTYHVIRDQRLYEFVFRDLKDGLKISPSYTVTSPRKLV